MFGFLIFILIILSVIYFLLGYACLNNKAESLIMWRFDRKKVTDKEGYKKQQGKHSILMGIIFLLIPFTLYLVEIFDINPKSLRLWLLVLAGVIISNAIQVKKYFK